jgi:hypothetical protein
MIGERRPPDRVVVAPQTPFAPGDEAWDARFVLDSLNGGVAALAGDAAGNLYAGGAFTAAGSVPTNRIARWDGGAWHTLGSGMDGGVLALGVSGSNVYAGGAFTTAGGIAAGKVARWDGSAWQALGTGVSGGSGYVYALAVSGSDVYAGGSFTTAGGAAASNVARWDGSAWHALGTGVAGPVKAVAILNGQVYVGGFFTTAGGGAANNIARWDPAANGGAGAWYALGSGLTSDEGDVRALAVYSGSLYAGGQFNAAGGTPVNNIARWDPAANGGAGAWYALGNGITGAVSTLASDSSALYAGGYFTSAGGAPANNIARWDGATWYALGAGITVNYAPVSALATLGSNVYAGGLFYAAGDVVANNLARWDGAAWYALGQPNSVNGRVNAIAQSGSELYIGGKFTAAGGVLASNIARWDSAANGGAGAWYALGAGITGFSGEVYAIAVSGSDVYVGGYFFTAGGASIYSIARWDGAAWHTLDTGISGYVYSLVVSNGLLYVGGNFAFAGSVPAANIARWDPAANGGAGAWSALGSGVSGSVRAIAISGSHLYAGGYFTTAGGNPVSNIARWDGAAWSALGAGVNAYVNSLAIGGSDLYVGGDFYSAGGVAANRIARWDTAGEAWYALGSGMAGYHVYALAVSESGAVYAGGEFTSVGDSPANYIARWDPAANGGAGAWQPLGSGASKTVQALLAAGRALYVGGQFTLAGGQASNYLGKYTLPYQRSLPLVVRVD